MLIFGLVFLLLGIFTAVHILFVIGVIMLIVGAVVNFTNIGGGGGNRRIY